MPTDRLIPAYERHIGRTLYRARIDLLTGIYRLAALGHLANDAKHLPTARRNVAGWAARNL